MNEWIWAMIQAIVVLITLPLIYRQVRIQTEQVKVQSDQVRLQTATHVVQTLGAIHSRWTEDAMLRARHSVCSRYLAKTLTFDGVSEYIAEYMEELGGYVQMRAVPQEVMWGAQSWYLEHYYCMFKDGIRAMRQSYHDETLYSNTERLFNDMRSHSKAEGAPSAERGPDDLRRFAESEVLVAAAFLNLQVDRQPLPSGTSDA